MIRNFLIIDPANADPNNITVDVVVVTETPLLNQDNNEILSPGDGEILIDTSEVVSSLPIDQFEVFTPLILISIFGKPTSAAHFGLKIYSLCETVDMYNNAQYNSGLGGKRRDVEADIYVHNSVGMDYTSNAGLNDKTIWQTLLFLPQQPILNQMTPLFTGKKKIKTLNGYSTEANIGLRSDSPYCLTVTQIGPSGSKT